jgi:protein involved in polysaccharide export with SLBB domain
MNLKITGRRLDLVLLFSVILALSVFLILSSGHAHAQLSSLTFKKGDGLRLTIWQPYRIGDSKTPSIDINGEYIIDSRGAVFFPIIGEVRVVGHSTQSLADELKEKLSVYLQEPIVVVEPLIRVTMMGAFRRPGTYLISPDASFWELVNLAGGPDDNANLKKMVVERGGKVVKKNILGGFERAYTLQEMNIFSGDQVFVPIKKEFRVRDAFEIVRFGITLINLYLLIQNLDNR